MSNLLLECLFQLRALRDTVGRVRDLAATAPTEADAGELLRRVRGMLTAEARWQEMLSAMLPAKLAEGFVPPEKALGTCADPVEAFARARMSTHAALDACNARDLGRLWPLEVGPAKLGEDVPAADRVPADAGSVEAGAAKGRTVADVVAMMLANDTDALGGLKYRFGVRKR